MPPIHRVLRRPSLLLVAFTLFACDDGTEPSVPTEMTLVSGNEQTIDAGAALPQPLVVRITDQHAEGMPGVQVTWTVTGGGGSMASVTTSTNGAGEAQVEWTIGATVAVNTATASVDGLSAVSFTAGARPGPPARILLQGGTSQTAKAATAVADSLAVKVTDQYGNAVDSVEVTWVAVPGSGTADPATSTTAGGGIARASWTLGRHPGVNSLAAASGAVSGVSVAFQATATPNATIAGSVSVSGEMKGFSRTSTPSRPSGGSTARASTKMGSIRGFRAPAARTVAPAPARAERADGTRLIVTYRARGLGAPASGSGAYFSRSQSRAVAQSIQQRLSDRATAAGARVEGVSPALLTARVLVPDANRAAEVRAQLARDPEVASVEPEVWYHATEKAVVAGANRPSIPNDPLYGQQSWHYNMVDLPRAWRVTTGSSGVLVAVIDDGIRFDHPAIAANLTSDGYDFVSYEDAFACGGFYENAGDGDGYDPDPTIPHSFDCSGTGVRYGTAHGLHVAGTIGATGNDGVGAAGVNWTVRIRPIRALGLFGGSSYDIAQAVLYAAGLPADNGAGGQVQAPSGAKIINMSLGGSTYSAVVHQAIQAATLAGALVVVSAGNDNTSAPSYPAALDEVISVGAVSPYSMRASYSNYGSTVDIAAPGGEMMYGASFGIGSLGWDFATGHATFAYLQGTSMAAPHVAGVAALLLAAEPSLTPAQLRSRLLDYAVDLGAAGRDDQFGHGLVNARNSLTRTTAPARSVHARLYDAATGALVRTVAGAGSTFELGELDDGSYHLFAGLDEEGDGLIGAPGRVWGAFTAAGRLAMVTVDGAGVYTANPAVGFPNETEPNGDLAQANRIVPGGYLHGRIGSTSDEDVYVVTLPAGVYTFETSGWNGDACAYATAEDTRLQLARVDGTVLASNDDIDPAASNYCSRITRSLEAGTYSLTVTGFDAQYYRLEARIGS